MRKAVAESGEELGKVPLEFHQVANPCPIGIGRWTRSCPDLVTFSPISPFSHSPASCNLSRARSSAGCLVGANWRFLRPAGRTSPPSERRDMEGRERHLC